MKEVFQLVCPECMCEVFCIYSDASACCAECGQEVMVRKSDEDLPVLH